MRLSLKIFCHFFLLLVILWAWYKYKKWNITVYQTGSIPRASFQPNADTEKISFIVGGVQKAGTTAIFKYLRQHPYLLLPPWKESHFFDNERIDWKAPNYTAYELFGHSRKKSIIAGKITPSYIYWPNSLERIKRYNPDMKLIFLFRQPVQRAWSQWKMEVARDIETNEGTARSDS